jgi:hypothetical protein
MGQRMRPQKMLGFKQGDQTCQSGLGSHISFPRCVLPKPSPPILLPLAVDSRKPLPQGDLPEKAQKNREPDHLEPSIILLGPQRMNRATVRAPIALQPQRPLKFVKIPPHIPMAPQPWASASRTPWGTRPRILLSHLLQELDIEIAVQYQVSSLSGITGDSSPARDSSSVIPSLSLQLILRRKKIYTTNSEILGRVLGRTM